jgi:CRISPR/Cas system-associated exonuclease Cas4 (RecB family)
MSRELLLSINKVNRLSPTQYNEIKLCRLRGILSANHNLPLLPFYPSMHLGQAIHSLLEFAYKGMIKDEKELNQVWTSIIGDIEKDILKNKLESHFVPLENSVRQFHVKKIIAFNTVRKLIKDYDSSKKSQYETERFFQTEDGKIVGRIDLIYEKGDDAEIIDFKTGEIFEDLQELTPKKEYQIQLKIYAALFFLKKGIWPKKLILAGLNQPHIEIEYKPEESLNLLDKVKEELSQINKLRTEGLIIDEFAQPSVQSCRFCGYRPGCSVYWNNRKEEAGWPLDFWGDIKEKKRLGNGFYKVVLLDNSREINIRGLSDRHVFLAKDINKILICNVGKDTSINNFIELPMTTGYVLK